ncbi:hypothetical protein [Salidesulfovibrio onnuriiensis]|uniref:hypothetical protein n=1 Tax=Salidesulfovibrio onnuriiensis TaxID=2583823 RepID=UPI0011CBDE5D|nr:hypothetical protein [Salidesulfovibrio onnuriiensis]
MRHTCILCGKQIENHDFFMDYGQGNVCSTCLVGLEVPNMGISALFMQDHSCEAPKYEPSEELVLEAMQAIS